MQFTSLSYIIFLAAAAGVSYVVPRQYRYLWLLAGSLFFYAHFGIAYLLILLLTIMITFRAARTMAGKEQKARARYYYSCLFGILAIFLFFKYADAFMAAAHLSMSVPMMSAVRRLTGADRILLPAGMSFYMFQEISYLTDCYKGRMDPEDNPGRYALYVSFFPQIVSGPIERAWSMLPQYREPEPFDYNRVRDGVLLMLWGYFQKMVLADRAAMIVNGIYAYPGYYSGTMVRLAVLLYSIQLYLDFSGYSCIAVGAAKIMGFRLTMNFNAPFFSATISEFWRRWHISLSQWLRDYIYIPLGGNKKGKKRQYLNIMIVFLVSGMWHGADITYVIWGALHGLYEVAGSVLKPLRDRVITALQLDRLTAAHRLYKTCVTFLLVSFAFIWFRADNVQEAVLIIRNLLGVQPWRLVDGTLYSFGMNAQEIRLLFAGIALVLLNDGLHMKGISLSGKVGEQPMWLRWTIYLAAFLVVIICGTWGPGYSEESFIYSHF